MRGGHRNWEIQLLNHLQLVGIINDERLIKLRIVVPEAIRPHQLQQLHRAHAGVDRMKQLARRHIWWPAINVHH